MNIEQITAAGLSREDMEQIAVEHGVCLHFQDRIINKCGNGRMSAYVYIRQHAQQPRRYLGSLASLARLSKADLATRIAQKVATR